MTRGVTHTNSFPGDTKAREWYLTDCFYDSPAEVQKMARAEYRKMLATARTRAKSQKRNIYICSTLHKSFDFLASSPVYNTRAYISPDGEYHKYEGE